MTAPTSALRINSPPYIITWNSTGVADGSHTLSAVAEGVNGAYATSTATVTVDNTPPSIPADLTVIATSSTEVDLSWNASTDNVAVAGYGIFLDGSQIATTSATAYADTGLTADTTYTYVVKAFDELGNTFGLFDLADGDDAERFYPGCHRLR